MKSPWYADGLRFECSQCGRCCTRSGEHSYVYLRPVEVRETAAFLGLEEDRFRERFCVEDEGWTVLRMDGPACPFLGEDHRCRIYPVRPRQCRTWPFWEENLASPIAWEAAKEVCPGIGSGPRFEWQEAAEIARGCEEWYLADDE